MNSGVNVDLSVLIPSIRPQNWNIILDGIKNALKIEGIPQYTYEVIFITPTDTDRLDNSQILISYRCPSACLQEGASIATGEILCWIPDDCLLEPEGLARSIRLLKNTNRKYGITLRYSEGINFSGNQDNWYAYWKALTHDGLRFKQVRDWAIAPCFMYYTEFFKEMGGLDCRMEHVNMNCHDLAFRIQLLGSKLLLSPTKIFSANWDEKLYDGDHKDIQLAYDENDLPLFKSIWDADVLDRSLKIDFDNWKNTDLKWKRRFK